MANSEKSPVTAPDPDKKRAGGPDDSRSGSDELEDPIEEEENTPRTAGGPDDSRSG